MLIHQKEEEKKENVLCDELRALLDESVKDQLIADVPVGTFLSGGIDSSIVTYISNIYSPDIYAFTIGFENPKFDESRYARILTDRYKLNCVEKILADQDIHAINQKLKVWYDEPFADTSAYPSFIVSQLAREKVTVVLTGDGGDELFGGYTRYQIYDNWMKDKELDSQMLSDMCRRFNITDLFSNKMKKRYINTGLEIYLPVIFLADKKATENYRKQWGIDKDYDVTWYLKKYYKKELPPMTRARYMDFKTYLPSDILTKVDRVSMANSLETRVPFLSRKIIEFAFSLSEEECCTSKNLKGILKSAFNKEIPDDLLYRKKMGFSVPEEYLADKRGGIPITVGILKSEWKEIDKNVENIGRK